MIASSKRIYTFAIIGFGSRGRDHLRSFEGMTGRMCRCIAVSDPREPDAATRKRFGAAYYRDHHKLLKDQRPDFVVVASPEVFHVPQALLRSGSESRFIWKRPYPTLGKVPSDCIGKPNNIVSPFSSATIYAACRRQGLSSGWFVKAGSAGSKVSSAM